jgi:hypothetical protein
MNDVLFHPQTTRLDRTVVASYTNHANAEAAVRRLASDGLPIMQMSIIGRNFETHEDIQGFYRPADAAMDGAKEGAVFGGIFGGIFSLMFVAVGFFILPVVGSVLIIGPLAATIGGAIGGAGAGALLKGLVQIGIPREQALKYQERLKVGEFLVALHGSKEETNRAHYLLQGTALTHLQTHATRVEKPALANDSHA